MKICYFGIYNKDYPRNDILMSGLKLNSCELVECNEDWNKKGRYISLYKKLKALNNDYDLIYCAYPATVPTILAKIISNKPVVMDAFYSMFDSVVWDRKEIKWYHPRAIKLLFLDWISAVVSDHMVVDTLAHKNYWTRWPFVDSEKISIVYIGANDKFFHKIDNIQKDTKYFWVSFHGMFIPLHGLDKIIEVARILKEDDSIRFRLIGSGAESKKVKKLIKDYNLKNIEEIERVPMKDINTYLNRADVILGIFGDTKKASRVIPNKLYEGMAVKKPVINMDSEVTREIFDGNDLLLLKNNPDIIAKGILELKNNPKLREKLVNNAYDKMTKYYFPKPLGRELLGHLSGLLDKR